MVVVVGRSGGLGGERETFLTYPSVSQVRQGLQAPGGLLEKDMGQKKGSSLSSHQMLLTIGVCVPPCMHVYRGRCWSRHPPNFKVFLFQQSLLDHFQLLQQANCGLKFMQFYERSSVTKHESCHPISGANQQEQSSQIFHPVVLYLFIPSAIQFRDLYGLKQAKKKKVLTFKMQNVKKKPTQL